MKIENCTIDDFNEIVIGLTSDMIIFYGKYLNNK